MLVPRSQLFKSVANPCAIASDDGSRIAFVRSSSGIKEIHVSDLGSLDRSIAVTESRCGFGVSSSPWRAPLWSNGDTSVVFQREVELGPAAFRIFSIDLIRGTEIDLLPLPQGRARVAEISSRIDTRIAIHSNGRDLRYEDIHVVDVSSNNIVLHFQNSEGWDGIWCDGDLVPRVAQRANTQAGGFSLHTLPDQKSFFEVEAEDDLTSRVLGISHDGGTVYMLSGGGQDKAQLVGISARTGQKSYIASHPVVDVSGLILDPVDRLPQAAIAGVDYPKMISLSSEFTAAQDKIGSRLGADFLIERTNRSFNRWSIATFSGDRPARFYVTDPASSELWRVDSEDGGVSSYASSVRHLSVASRDGHLLHCFLTTPRFCSTDSPALVVKLHGGPWSRDFGTWDAEAQWLANRGYAVLAVNFRGSSGFGKRFLNSGAREWGRKILNDIDDVVCYITSGGLADPKRVALFGHSFGGYAALMAAIRRPDLYCAASISSAPLDLEKLFLIPEWDNFAGTLRYHLGDPADPGDLMLMRSSSPLRRAGELVRPVLLDLGEQEAMDLVADSRSVVEIARANGIDATLVVFANESHVVRGAAATDFRRYLIEKFLSNHLGGRCEAWNPLPVSSLLSTHIGLEHLHDVR